MFTATFGQTVSAANHRAKQGYWAGPVPDMGTYPITPRANLFGRSRWRSRPSAADGPTARSPSTAPSPSPSLPERAAGTVTVSYETEGSMPTGSGQEGRPAPATRLPVRQGAWRHADTGRHDESLAYPSVDSVRRPDALLLRLHPERHGCRAGWRRGTLRHTASSKPWAGRSPPGRRKPSSHDRSRRPSYRTAHGAAGGRAAGNGQRRPARRMTTIGRMLRTKLTAKPL